jgi:hypothetical protein
MMPRKALTKFAAPEVEAAYSDCPRELQQRMRGDVLRQMLARGLVRAEGYIEDGLAPEPVPPTWWEDAVVPWGRDPGADAVRFSNGKQVTGLRMLLAGRDEPPKMGPAERPAFDRMIADVDAGRLTLAELEDLADKELAAHYGAAASTARRARAKVLAYLNTGAAG